MLNVMHTRLHVIRPTLEHLGLWSPSAEALVLGTALTESRLSALDQITGPGDTTLGPAYGLFQIEPFTHDDLWRNWLPYRPGLTERLNELLAEWPEAHHQLVTNLAYAAAICRMIYRRRPEALPTDLRGRADYWKAHYNTKLGKGHPDDFVHAWKLAGLDPDE